MTLNNGPQTSTIPFALPAPEHPNSSGVTTLNVDDSKSSTARFDAFGPLIVNSDGTLSRIANWQNMTEEEQSRTFRVLNARNKIRLENEEKMAGSGSAEDRLTAASN